jgi:hypothetical protein
MITAAIDPATNVTLMMIVTVGAREAHGVTTMTSTLSFRDQAGRDHMTTFDGQEDSYDKMEDLLRSLLDREGSVSG